MSNIFRGPIPRSPWKGMGNEWRDTVGKVHEGKGEVMGREGEWNRDRKRERNEALLNVLGGICDLRN